MKPTAISRAAIMGKKTLVIEVRQERANRMLFVHTGPVTVHLIQKRKGKEARIVLTLADLWPVLETLQEAKRVAEECTGTSQPKERKP